MLSDEPGSSCFCQNLFWLFMLFFFMVILLLPCGSSGSRKILYYIFYMCYIPKDSIRSLWQERKAVAADCSC